MKPSTKDQVQGSLHEMIGKAKEKCGRGHLERPRPGKRQRPRRENRQVSASKEGRPD